MGPLGASSTCFGMRRQHVIYTCLTIALVWLAVQWAWETDKDGSAASSSDSTFVFQFKFFLAGSICACLSHVGGVPIDVLKTRLQTDPGRYDGLWDAAVKVTRTEGPGMLLQGLGPTATGYAVQGGLKYGLYELFKVSLAEGGPVLALPLPLLLVAAACAEFIASTALCPYEAARIRLVADPTFAVGLIPALRRLVSEQGIYGVFGALPAMYLKMVPYTMAQLATYDGVTRALASHVRGSVRRAAASGGSASSSSDSKHVWGYSSSGDLITFGIALCGAALAAVVASLASQPGDTLLSKLNQGRRALIRVSPPPSASSAGTPGGLPGLKSASARKSWDSSGSGAGNSGGASSGAGSIVTSSDDEMGMSADEPLAAGDAGGGPGGSGDAGNATPRNAAAFGCGPMCALASRLGPAGLMLGWQARLMHTGTIVLFQLLIYDAVKAAVGLPVSAHGGVERRLF